MSALHCLDHGDWSDVHMHTYLVNMISQILFTWISPRSKEMQHRLTAWAAAPASISSLRVDGLLLGPAKVECEGLNLRVSGYVNGYILFEGSQVSCSLCLFETPR